MPVPVTDELMQHMIDKGYIVVSETQDSKLPYGETLYEFGRIPPEDDEPARELFFQLYRESKKYTLVEGKVYRNSRAKSTRHRRRR